MRFFFIFFLFSISSFSGYCQSEQLAKNYFDQGEYEKALQTYKNLLKEDPGNPDYFFGLISAHQELENFSEAEKLLLEKVENSANLPTLLVELGHNYELQRNRGKADLYYEEALKAIEARPNYAYSIAQHFEKYSLLDNAVKAYEIGIKLNPDANYNIQLARIYGEQGELEKMFSNYIELVEKNPAFLSSAYQSYSRFISEDPSQEANIIFRKLLLKKLQENQEVMYNEMLSWLFVQQREFKKAFLQEKAVYRREQAGLGRIIQLALMAGEENPDTAMEVLDFIIEEAASEEIKIQAHQRKLDLRRVLAGPKDHKKIEQAYRDLFEEYGNGLKMLPLKLDFSDFLAFHQDKTAEGIGVLKELLEKNPGKMEEAVIKMALADILVFEEKFNPALIYYSQVQKLVKNNTLSQEARFKVAKTSYYKGDFEWAQLQLDVLKASTSQLIANDAMELSLLISDNTLEDSTQTALKLYARADLLAFQQRNEAAIELLNEVLKNHKAEKIEDEALLKQAELFEKTGEYTRAEENYLKLIQLYPKGILGDNAYYGLAELYAAQMGKPEKALGFYEKIVFNYADSIYFVDSRKKYRKLRGDDLE